jgi:hypothetical protein
MRNYEYSTGETFPVEYFLFIFRAFLEMARGVLQ